MAESPMATIADIRKTEPITPEQDEGFNHIWDSPKGLLAKLSEINNIPIAHRYMAAGFAFFLIGGLQALVMRIQLGTPDNTFLDPATYNQLFSMHGTTMMFLFVIPFIEALANYMLPLLLGTRDLPFPRLTALSFWTYVFGGTLLYSSFFFGVAPDGGWFAYVPLTNREYSPGINMDFWDIGLSVAEVAAMGAAAELIISILRMRAPGMTLSRMPIFAWSMLVTAVMIIFAFTPLIVATAMLEFDRKGLTSFFVPEHGGEPLLWQHFFWVFGHPEVYIMFIPAVGIVTHIVQALARRPVVGYPLIVVAIISTGFISFGLWVHHMFTTGLSPVAMGFFTAASMMIAIPSGVQIFSWIATLWLGRPQWRTPLLFVAGFIVIFVLGGVTGVMVAAVPFDWQVHDSYFVVAHFHYVLIGGVVFPLIAGLYYWLPKVTGKLMSERLGRWNFWTMFVFFNVAFFPMHIVGLLGMPRRIYTYPSGLGWDTYNLVATIGALGFGFGVLLFLVNFFWSLRRGAPAGHNPWNADTLEWAEPSPPPNAQFQFIPEIRSRHPLWEQKDLAPQDPEVQRLLKPVQSAPTGWRGALIVSVVDARPIAIVHVPTATLSPFITSVGFLFLFAGLILDALWLIGLGVAATVIGVIGWFWPNATEKIAMAEIDTAPREGQLPLAVAGPTANGYWGMMVFLFILGTALACLVASYFYLGEGPASWPPPSLAPRDLTAPLTATASIAILGLATVWLSRSTKSNQITARRAAITVALIAAITFVVVSIMAYAQTDLTARGSAYASIVLHLLGFEWIVTFLLAVMLAVALAWSLRRPADRRGDAVALNAALLSYFVVGGWLVVFATVYLSPYVW